MVADSSILGKPHSHSIAVKVSCTVVASRVEIAEITITVIMGAEIVAARITIDIEEAARTVVIMVATRIVARIAAAIEDLRIAIHEAVQITAKRCLSFDASTRAKSIAAAVVISSINFVGFMKHNFMKKLVDSHFPEAVDYILTLTAVDSHYLAVVDYILKLMVV